MKSRIYKIIIWGGLLLGLTLVLGLTTKRHESSVCRDVQISIKSLDGDNFITEKDIRKYITLLGDSVKGQQLGFINLHALEMLISNNPYVSKALVFATIDGIIRIEVFQRKPIVRVQNSHNKSFYISDDGRLMPTNIGRPARVLFASGRFDDPFLPRLNLNITEINTKTDSIIANSAIYRIFKIASYINNDAFLKAQIEQLYLNNNNDFELIPMVGKHLIILGDEKELEKKFDKLKIFYERGLSVEGWNKYDTINLKFENQVVCTKIKI